MLQSLKTTGTILGPRGLVTKLSGKWRQVPTVLKCVLSITIVLILVLHCIGRRTTLNHMILQTISRKLTWVSRTSLHLLQILLILIRSCLLLLNSKRWRIYLKFDYVLVVVGMNWPDLANELGCVSLVVFNDTPDYDLFFVNRVHVFLIFRLLQLVRTIF